MQRTWAETQAAFAGGILDSRVPRPQGVIECGSSSRGGYAVHRNNALTSLVDVLQERFEVTCRLVGEEFFRAMARAYAVVHRPRSPLLMDYGDNFPAFIDSFKPADDVSYLSDVARLEAAWSEAYHAPEDRALQPNVLADIPHNALLEMRLTLHRSTRILRSVHPVAGIWAAHQGRGAVPPPMHWEGQDVLIVRPHAEVQIHMLGPGVHEFVSALLDRRCLQDASEIALISNSDFDAGMSLTKLFGIGAVVALTIADTEEN